MFCGDLSPFDFLYLYSLTRGVEWLEVLDTLFALCSLEIFVVSTRSIRMLGNVDIYTKETQQFHVHLTP